MALRQKEVVLLDVHAIIHRAYHALPDFTSHHGEPTGALYGLAAMLLKILRDRKPSYIIACYDMAKPTFRHDVYKEYKAGRAKADDNLVAQIQRSYDIFSSFGIPVYQKEGYEADDIIGTVAEILKKKEKIRVVIASGDMDTLQLVDDNKVVVLTLRKGINDVVLYDEKAVYERFGFAPALLPDFKGLRGDPSDNIIGVRGIGEKTASALIKEFGSLENIYSALKRNRSLFLKKGFSQRIISLLEEGKEEALFSKELALIKKDVPLSFQLPKKPWPSSCQPDHVLELFSELGFRSLAARFRALFPEFHQETNNIEKDEGVSEEEIQKLCIAVWLLDSSLTNPTRDDILRFARARTIAEARKKILAQIKENKLDNLYFNIELPLMPILRRMEERGILMDLKFLRSLSRVYHKELSSLEKAIWKDAGKEFNINSPKQLSEVLFDDLKIRASRVRKTSTGARSTRAGELEKLRGAHPIIEKLLKYREYQKLLSTYIDNLPRMVDKNYRLHTRFVQTGTTTGRIASWHPNLQNIPIKTPLGQKIRRSFLATKNHMLVSFDYSQVELRVAAFLSKDPKLKEIFIAGRDVHNSTAAEIFKVPLREVTPEMRRIAKTINFGILYGMGVNALRENLGTSREEARAFYDKYFSSFSVLASYLEQVKENARKRGYTETYFGRRRYFPGLRSSLPHVRAQEERMAVNAPIQGTSADMIKKAMVDADTALEKHHLHTRVHFLLQIHDEIICEIETGVVPDAAALIKEAMEKVIESDIPFVVDVFGGYNWGEMKPII